MKAAVILVILVMATVTLYSHLAGSFPGISVPVMQAPGRTPIPDHLEHRLEPFRDIAGSADEMYRLFKTAGLGRTSRSILLMRNGKKYSLRYQRVEGGSAFAPSDTTIIVSEDEWNECRGLIEDMDFWEMPSRTKRLGMDGITVVLEGFREGRYHYIERWSLPEKSALERYCARLGNITEIGIGMK